MSSTTTTVPKVTICLPTIGRLAYMSQTLDSLRNQTLTDYELLILYNGSDATVLEQLTTFVHSHPGGRVLSESAPMAMFANFNRGLREARGEYVAFFHDDDVYEPRFLERIIALLDSHPNAAFAGSNYLIIDSKDQVRGHRRLIKRTEIQRGREFICELVRRGRGAIPTPGIVFRKNSFGPEGWDEKLSMHFGDFVVLMRMAETHDAALIAEPLMRIRLHAGNASNVLMSDAGPMQFRIVQSYISEFARRWPSLDSMTRSLQTYSRGTLIRYLTWGWVSAEEDDEADRCIALMEKAGAKSRAAALGFMSGIGFRASRRRRLTNFIRRIGRSMG